MDLSFSNLLVRQYKENSMDSFLSFGEIYKYSIIFYIVLKRFLTTQFDCLFTINSIFNYMSMFYDTKSDNNKSDKYKRQKQYFKLFLQKIIYSEIFSMADVNISALNSNRIQSVEDAVDKISSSNDLVVLSLNTEKEKEYGFTIIDEQEVIKILQYSKTNIDNIKLLNLYCDISSRIFQPKTNDGRCEGEQYKYCYPSFETFIVDGVLSKKDTLKSYLDILVDLNLIRYQGVGDMSKDNQIRTGNYHYILVKDYSNYSDEEYGALFKNILSGYKRIKKDEGWKIIGNSNKRKKIECVSEEDQSNVNIDSIHVEPKVQNNVVPFIRNVDTVSENNSVGNHEQELYEDTYSYLKTASNGNGLHEGSFIKNKMNIAENGDWQEKTVHCKDCGKEVKVGDTYYGFCDDCQLKHKDYKGKCPNCGNINYCECNLPF